MQEDSHGRARAHAGWAIPAASRGRATGRGLGGLLFLLTPGTDPEGQAAALTPQLGPLDRLPPDGAVMPIWSDDADAWDCDAQALAEARGRLDAAAVVLVATVQYATGERKVAYRQLSRDIVADARQPQRGAR